jgi:hypothetical protein
MRRSLALGLNARWGAIAGCARLGSSECPHLADAHARRTYSKVTQATISTTICKSGWTATIRPPASYTNALKRAQLAEWHYADQNPSHYEEDHLISLEVGGAPWSKKNLWPEPHSESAKSDPMENAWHNAVCNGTMTLKQARHAELVYKSKFG